MGEPDLQGRMRDAVRQLNVLAYERGAALRMEFDQIEEISAEHDLHAWVVSDEVIDWRDGGYWRVFRLSPAPETEDEGHGGVVIESALRPQVLPMFNLYRHDDEVQRDGVEELRARYPSGNE